MIIENHHIITHKSKIFTSVMKNKDMAKVMFNAWNSPIGSTHRKRASGILKSVSQAHINYSRINDGQGGGLWPVTPLKTLDITGSSSNMNVGALNSSPTPPAPTSSNGMFGMSGTGILGNGSISNADLSSANIPGVLPTPTPLQLAPPSTKLMKNHYIGADGQMHILGPLDPGYQPLTIEDISNTTVTPAPTTTTNYTSNGVSSMYPNNQIPGSYPGVTNPYQTGTSTSATGATGTETPVTPLPTNADASTNPMTDPTSLVTQYMQAMKDTYGANTMQSWYNSLSPAVQKQYKPALDAVMGGIGKTTFAFKMLTDKPSLAALLNVPLASLSKLPDSGDLTDQLNALYRTTRQKYNLDDLEKKYTDMIYSGGMAETTLDTYIRNNDTYLNDVNNMINKTKIKIDNSDLSNPNDATRMANYMNYLGTLKTSQNTRYMNMVQLGLKQYQAEFNTLQADYNIKRQDMQDEYNIASTGATNTFNNYQAMLEDLYTNVEGQYTNFQKANTLQDTNFKTISTLMNDEISRQKTQVDMQKIISDMSGGSYDKFNAANIDAALGITTNPTTKFDEMKSYDPVAALDSAAASKQSPLNLLNRFNAMTVTSLSDSLSGGSTSGINQYNNTYSNYSDLQNQLTTLSTQLTTADATTKPAIQSQIDAINQKLAILSTTATSIGTGAKDGLARYLSGVSTAASDIKNAAHSLQGQTSDSNAAKQAWINGGGGFLGFGGGKSYGALSSDFASLLWDYYWQVKNSGGDAFNEIDTTDDSTLLHEIASDLSGYVQNNLVTQILPTTSQQ